MLAYYKKFKFLVRTLVLNCYLYSHDLISILFQSQKIKKAATNFNSQDTIGIISDLMLPRVKKIISGLHSAGYKVILITKVSEYNLSEAYIYKSPLKALWLAKQFQPIVYHVFSSWRFETAYKIIKNKKKLPAPVIFDDYDVMLCIVNKDYANMKFPGQMNKEKFCLENADGLCCRSLETQAIKRELKIKFKAKRIFFPEYIYENEIANAQKDETKNRTLVYAGNYNATCIRIAEELSTINWQMDLYPATTRVFFKLLPLNLNLFKKLPYDELISVLPKYKFALQMPAEIAEGPGIYSLNKRKLAMSGKIFDYMGAGLKVLISDYDLLIFILKRYNSCVLLDSDNPVSSIPKKLMMLEEFKISTFANFEKIKMDYNIERLVKFYKSV